MLGNIKNKTNKEFEELRLNVPHINEKLIKHNHKLMGDNNLQDILDNFPNPPADEVQYGNDEIINKFIRLINFMIDMNTNEF